MILKLVGIDVETGNLIFKELPEVLPTGIGGEMLVNEAGTWFAKGNVKVEVNSNYFNYLFGPPGTINQQIRFYIAKSPLIAGIQIYTTNYGSEPSIRMDVGSITRIHLGGTGGRNLLLYGQGSQLAISSVYANSTKFSVRADDGRIFSSYFQAKTLVTANSAKEIVSIADGLLGQVLTTDGNGNYNWADVSTGTDEQVKVDADDTTSGYLEDKLTSSDNSIGITNTGSQIDLKVVNGLLPEEGTSGQTLRHNGTGWEGNDILTIKEVSDNYPEGNTVEIYKESTSFLGSDARLKVKHKQFGLSGNYQIQESQVVAGASGEIGLIAKRNSYNNLGEDEDIQFDVEFSNQRIKNSLFAEEYSEDKIIGVDAFGEFKKMDGISITDERVKVNIDDPESGFLEDKIESVDDRIVINNTGSTLELSLDIPSPNLIKYVSTDNTSMLTSEWQNWLCGLNIEADVTYELCLHLVFGNTSGRNGVLRLDSGELPFTYRPIVTGNINSVSDNVIIMRDTVEDKPDDLSNEAEYTFQTKGYKSSIIEMRGIFRSTLPIPILNLKFKTLDNLSALVLKAYSYLKLSR